MGSWLTNHRMATRRFSSSIRSRSAHSECRSAGHSALTTSAREVLGVSLLDSVPVGTGGEALGGELAHRREHPEPRPGVGRDDAHEAVPSERIQQVEHLVFGALGDDRRGGDRPSVGEDRQARPGAAVPRRRGGRRSIRPSPAGCVAVRGDRPDRCPSASSTILESGEQRNRFEQPGARRRQLDGERQTVEAPADLRDGEHVVLGQGEVVADGLGPIDEQLHGGQRRELFDRRSLRERRHRQRRRPGTPARHGAAARCGSWPGPQPRAARQELVELGRDTDHLLEVVQHEQRRACSSKCSIRASTGGRVPSMVAPTAAATRGSTSSGSAIEASGTNTVRRESPIVEVLTDGDRQSRLADATRTGEGDQPHVRATRAVRSPRRCRAGGRSTTSTTPGAIAGPAGRRSNQPRRSPRSVGTSTGRRREPLTQERGQVVADQPTELAWSPERPVRVGPLGLELADHGRQLRFPIRRRCLDVQEPRERIGEPELILET